MKNVSAQARQNQNYTSSRVRVDSYLLLDDSLSERLAAIRIPPAAFTVDAIIPLATIRNRRRIKAANIYYRIMQFSGGSGVARAYNEAYSFYLMVMTFGLQSLSVSVFFSVAFNKAN